MASSTLIPVHEYLSTTYRPDVDYIDGELQERNMGERPHGMLQFAIAAIFNVNRRSWNVVAGTEIRMQINSSRFRIPDVTVLRRSDPVDPIIQVPPLICIEVLSPSDTIRRMQERIDDYLRMGVEHVWLIDPITRDAWIATADHSHTHVDSEFTVPGTPIRLGLAELFAELDDLLTQT